METTKILPRKQGEQYFIDPEYGNIVYSSAIEWLKLIQSTDNDVVNGDLLEPTLHKKTIDQLIAISVATRCKNELQLSDGVFTRVVVLVTIPTQTKIVISCSMLDEKILAAPLYE